MKKILFLTTAFFSTAVSGLGAVTLLDDFSPTSLSTGNTQISWTGGEASYSAGWAVSFNLDIPNTITAGDTLFSMGRGLLSERGYGLTFKYRHIAEAQGYTLQFGANGGGGVFSESVDRGLLLNSPLTLLVKQIENTETFSVSLYAGTTQVAAGTVGSALGSLTKGESTFWSNGGRTVLSEIQGAVFDNTASDMEVLTALGVVPEPATASLSLLGLGALLMRRRRP